MIHFTANVHDTRKPSTKNTTRITKFAFFETNPFGANHVKQIALSEFSAGQKKQKNIQTNKRIEQNAIFETRVSYAIINR